MYDIYIHFGGFYHYHDELIEHYIETCYEDEKINFGLTFINYGKEWLNFFNNETGQKLQFVEIVSPMYYNFSTDVIRATLLTEAVEKLENEYLQNAEFLKFAQSKVEPRSGFISYYNNIDNLIKLSKEDKKDRDVLTGLIIDFVTLKEEINEMIFFDFGEFMSNVEIVFNTETETETN